MLEQFYNTYHLQHTQKRMETRVGLTVIVKMERHLADKLCAQINDPAICGAEIDILLGDRQDVSPVINMIWLRHTDGTSIRCVKYNPRFAKYSEAVVAFWDDAEKELKKMHDQYIAESTRDGSRYVDEKIVAAAKEAVKLYKKSKNKSPLEQAEMYEDHNNQLVEIVLDYVYNMLEDCDGLPPNLLIGLRILSPVVFGYQCSPADFPLMEYDYLEFKSQKDRAIYKVRWIENMATIKRVRGELELPDDVLQKLETLFSLVAVRFNERLEKDLK